MKIATLLALLGSAASAETENLALQADADSYTDDTQDTDKENDLS
jgi:hypothetical protein